MSIRLFSSSALNTCEKDGCEDPKSVTLRVNSILDNTKILTHVLSHSCENNSNTLSFMTSTYFNIFWLDAEKYFVHLSNLVFLDQ